MAQGLWWMMLMGLACLAKVAEAQQNILTLKMKLIFIWELFQNQTCFLVDIWRQKGSCEYVKHTSRPFIFSASITPASVACALKSLEILENEPNRVEKLNQISGYMRKTS